MDILDNVKKAIKDSSSIVAFTGAGASTESGIPDFRSAKGLYSDDEAKNRYGYSPEYMLSHSFFINNTELFYDYYRNNILYPDAQPNDCHVALAKLEAMGKLKAVITQNIDGLHQAAGSRNVLELHGSVLRNYCMACKKKFGLDYIINAPQKIPYCDDCGGIVRPDVVLYEEMLDNKVLEKAISSIARADMLIVIGTSLVVYPAAGLVEYFRGNSLVLVNKSSTPYDSRADYVIRDSAGKVMRKLVLDMNEE